MPPEFRIALLGQGFMGKAHSNAYVQARAFLRSPVPRRSKGHLCDDDAASLSAMADRWGWEETATDWRAAIDRKDIDARRHLRCLIICTRAAAIAAAQAGKIVLCEKPLALSVAEARAMADAARDVPTLVWFNYRRVPAIAFARQLIDEGRLGHDLSLQRGLQAAVGRRHDAAATWRMDPALAGSGVADDLLTHCLDTALYLNGPMTDVGRDDAHALRRTAPSTTRSWRWWSSRTAARARSRRTRFGIGCKNRNDVRDSRRRRACCASISSG